MISCRVQRKRIALSRQRAALLRSVSTLRALVVLVAESRRLPPQDLRHRLLNNSQSNVI